MGEEQVSGHAAALSSIELVIDGDFDAVTAVRLLAREVRDLRERVARLEGKKGAKA